MARSKITMPQPDFEERTVRVARKRFARRQWTRRWLAWRRVLATVVVLGLAAGGVWLLFFSSVLDVADVSVEGTSSLSAREVRRAADVATGLPLARVDLDAVAARVKGLAPIKRVDVSRSWPHTVRVAVVERLPVAVVERDGVVRGLDDRGVLFRRYASRPADLPAVHTGAATGSAPLAEAASVVAMLPDDLAPKVDYVEVATIDTISLRLRNGGTIRWGSADDSASKAKVAEVLLRQKASTYDVSVPGRPTLTR